jgi:hypothetical protein
VIDDIVMEQGGDMQILKSNGQLVNFFVAVAAKPGGQYAKQGPYPFAAIEQGMLEDFGQLRGACLLPGKGFQVVMHGLSDFFNFRLQP